ncbi:MAG TPA: RNA polymerase sigma factor [Vicinamibacterales bacterium]|jgi:RNA polymerase sigma-70 factor (ECF subfamily)|nr:RNA polymerase sigma factor [Vicinamibacterales bacterium]
MTASDAAAVLARARQGDSEAFRMLVEQHSRTAFRLAFRMTGNEQDAEDVVQESFLKAYRYLGRFETRADFGTWLYRIVANCALDAIRSRQSRLRHMWTESFEPPAVTHASDRPGPERLAESAEVQRQVEVALLGLSPLERAAFALRHYEGRTIGEISGVLGLGTSAAKQAVFRAVRKLRVELEQWHTTTKTN